MDIASLAPALAGDDTTFRDALEKEASEVRVAILTGKTPENFVKTKPRRGGGQVEFVEGGYVVRALNLAFRWQWQFRTYEITLPSEPTIVIKGVLTVNIDGQDVTKEQYGYAQKQANVPLGDTYKSAATDALKKCASLLGIAGDVYGQTEDEPAAPAATYSYEKLEAAIENIERQYTEGSDITERATRAAKLLENTDFNDLKLRIARLKNGGTTEDS